MSTLYLIKAQIVEDINGKIEKSKKYEIHGFVYVIS